jgi:beta-galactosidase
MLDHRRFVSDEVNGFLDQMVAIVRKNAPGALTTGNMWYYSDKKYFDYAPLAYGGKVDRGGCGFYPGTSLVENGGLRHALFGIARIQMENTTPFWCTEFTTMTAVPGSIRRSAYASLMLGNQMVCGWTWQSMHGGEEQYLQGMVEWDGIPNRKYEEYKQIATEFRKIEKYGFPYKLQAEVGLAFSFPSQIVSYAYPERHDGQVQQAFDVLWERNVDCRVVDPARSDLRYKLLIIPGLAVMDETTAGKIREYVKSGGTVIMTSGSAVVDERNQVFASTRPGLLADVFGIRLAGLEEPGMLNELSPLGLKKNALRLVYGGKEIDTEASRFDVIESSSAQVLGQITSLQKTYPIITANRYGKGTAIYIGLPAKCEILAPVVEELIGKLAINTGPATPKGVAARYIDSKHILYLNLSTEPKVIQLPGQVRSILRDRDYTGQFTLQPFEPEFIEIS